MPPDEPKGREQAAAVRRRTVGAFEPVVRAAVGRNLAGRTKNRDEILSLNP